MSIFYTDSASFGDLQISGALTATASWAYSASNSLTASYVSYPIYIDNQITVGLPGSVVDFNSIQAAVNSIIDATQYNTYTVVVGPGVYIEDTITVPSWVNIKGDSSISTIVSASNPDNGIFVLGDQSMLIDMQIQGSTGTGAAAILYSSPTTPQKNAIAYVENVRFGSNYTNAKVVGTGGGNCILQCSNVKYGGFTGTTPKTFDIGFYATNNGSGIGRMQLRNVTSTSGGITGSADQIFALADQPGCTFIVNGCLLTKSTGVAAGTGFKIYNGGTLRLTGVNFQRWTSGIWAPQSGSAPSIDAIALNFENCTTDVLIEHSGSTGKVQGTDNFLKTQINLSSSLYEVGQDPRIITVAKKGGDFTSISSSVAYITDSGETNRYVISVGPGQFFEKEIDMTSKPYVSIVGSSIQTTQIFPSSSNQHLIKLGINNEVSFLSLTNAPAGYSALYIDDIGDYAQAHKVSFYDCDTCVTVLSSTQDTKFYGEYLDYNGVYAVGTYVSASNGFAALASIENYFQFPAGATGLIANWGTGTGAQLDLYAGAMTGESDSSSTAVFLEYGADMQVAAMDFPNWGTAVSVSNTTPAASFNMVGSMIHDSVTYDFDVQSTTAQCRYQGTADHNKVNNLSSNFFWAFLDATDGELDITRNLAVTFADGTHTDASTLIFESSTMGVLAGGEITVSGSLTVNIAAGYGYCAKPATAETYVRVDWPSQSLALSANVDNYLYFTDTAVLTANTSYPSDIEHIILGRVVTNTSTIEFIDQSPVDASHTSNKYSNLFRDALGSIYAFGSITSENVTPYHLDVTAGEYFYSNNKYTPSGGTDISFNRYFISASGWNKTTTNVVPSDVYTSGSALVAMSASYYTKHTLYLVGDNAEEKYFLVVNDNEYASLVQAENAGLPTIPTYFSDSVTSVAAIYVQSGSANITQIQDIRPTVGFRAAGVNASSVHANLLGLTADDHQQYLLVDGTRAMGGGLNMGNYAITNASYVSSSFTGSLLGTASYADNALTASYVQNAQTASYVLQAVSSSYSTTSSFTSTGNGIFSGSFSGSYVGDGGGLTGVIASAAPGGQDTSVQFNDAGSTSGSANFTFNKTTNKVSVTGSIHATAFSNTTKVSGSSAAAGDYITTQYLTGDVTNNTINLGTGMTTTNVVAGNYQFKYVVRYQSAATTTGIGLAADHTGIATYWVSSFWFVSTGGTAATGIADQVAAVNNGQMVEGKSERVKGTSTSATAGVDTLNADMLAVMEGVMAVSTNGDLQLKFKSEVAASTVTLKAGTCLILTKLS